MAEEKKTEEKDKSTRRSRNNPKAKEPAKKRTPKKDTSTKSVKEKKQEKDEKVVKQDVNPKEEKKEIKKVTPKEEVKVEPVKEEKEVKEKEPVKEIKVVSEPVKEVETEVKEEKVLDEVKTEVVNNEQPAIPPVTPQVAPVVTAAGPEAPVVTQTPNIEYELQYPASFFDGGLLSLIGWKLLSLLLTVISLGLLAPLGQVLVLKWQYKHTVINGRRLTFDGNYFQLLGKMICWVLLSIITLGIYLLFIPVAWNKWVTKHIHYEGGIIDPNKPSQFNGNTLQYIGIAILCFLMTLLSIGLLYPCAYCLAVNWRLKHTIIDGDNLEFDGKAIHLWGLYIKWIFFTIITLGIYSFWIPISLLKWETKHTNRKGLSKKPYNAVIAVVIPLILAAFIGGVAIAGIVSYVVMNKNSNEGTQEETKTGTEWGDKYYRYIRDDYNGEDVKGAFIDFNNDNVPELVLAQTVKYCTDCDANSDNIVVLYIKDDKVKQSSRYDDATVKQYYDMEKEEKEWFIVEDDKTYTNATSIVEEKVNSTVVASDAQIKDFEDKYIDTEVEVNYQDIEKDSAKKNITDLVTDYEDNKSYDNLSDSEIDEKVKEYEEMKELLAKSTLTEDNYKDKIGETIKWFNAAYLGEIYGWPGIFKYNLVKNVKVPGASQYDMIYEVTGLTSIDSLKEQLSKYVSEEKFSKFNGGIGRGFTEYNGKVYWVTGGVGDGPFLKDYVLQSSDAGISKVRLNIHDSLSGQLEQYIIVTIEFQPETETYLVIDWEGHAA